MVWESMGLDGVLAEGKLPALGNGEHVPAGRRRGAATAQHRLTLVFECDRSHIVDPCYADSGRSTVRSQGGATMDCPHRARVEARLDSGRCRGRNCGLRKSACFLGATRRFCQGNRPGLDAVNTRTWQTRELDPTPLTVKHQLTMIKGETS